MLQQTVNTQNAARSAFLPVDRIFAAFLKNELDAAALLFGERLPVFAVDGEHERSVNCAEDIADSDAFQAADLDGPFSGEQVGGYVEDGDWGIGCWEGEVE